MPEAVRKHRNRLAAQGHHGRSEANERLPVCFCAVYEIPRRYPPISRGIGTIGTVWEIARECWHRFRQPTSIRQGGCPRRAVSNLGPSGIDSGSSRCQVASQAVKSHSEERQSRQYVLSLITRKDAPRSQAEAVGARSLA
jgi:hypothetical protein